MAALVVPLEFGTTHTRFGIDEKRPLATLPCYSASHPLIFECDQPVSIQFERRNISNERLGTKYEGRRFAKLRTAPPIETLKPTTPIALAQ
jgi:hypothetical protein